ncbi:MAG: PilZ domain-containing protein [Terriglobales bacterium]
MADARAGKRFPVELPIRIVEADSTEEQKGITANVSHVGVYIRTEPSRRKAGETQWRPGARVEFDITLPANVIGAKQDVVVHCRGRVARVEKAAVGRGGEKHHGVACVIDKYEFVRGS